MKLTLRTGDPFTSTYKQATGTQNYLLKLYSKVNRTTGNATDRNYIEDYFVSSLILIISLP